MIGYCLHLDLGIVDLSSVFLAVCLCGYVKGTGTYLRKIDVQLRVDLSIKFELQQQCFEPIVEKLYFIRPVCLNIIDLFVRNCLQVTHGVEKREPRVLQRLFKSRTGGLNVCVRRVRKKLVTRGGQRECFSDLSRSQANGNLNRNRLQGYFSRDGRVD